MSSDSEAEAIKALLAAATKRPVLDPDEAQSAVADGTLPASHTIIYLSRRAGGQARSDGRQDPSGWRRLSTRVVSDTVTNARLLEDSIFAAFNLQAVTIAGQPVAVQYESGGGDFEFESGSYTALSDWTYVL